MLEPPLFARAFAALAAHAAAPWTEGSTSSRTSMVTLASALPRLDPRVQAAALCACVGRQLAATHRAFWFAQREEPLGFAMGFPRALVPFSVSTVVDDALAHGDLARIDRAIAVLGAQLDGTRPTNARAQPHGLSELDAERYQALFDPSLVQPMIVQRTRIAAALATTASAAAERVRSALTAVVNPVERESLDDAWRAPLLRMDPSMPLVACAATAPRAVEAFVALAAVAAAGAPAEEGFWADVVLAPVARAHAGEARVLGVFVPSAVAPIVAGAEPARSFVIAGDAGAALLEELSSVSIVRADAESAHPLLAAASAHRAELRALAARATEAAPLAFRRLTVADASREVAAAAVRAQWGHV
jgi:hypothetical protein